MSHWNFPTALSFTQDKAVADIFNIHQNVAQVLPSLTKWVPCVNQLTSMSQIVDEETPLLRDQLQGAQQNNPKKPQKTPLPWRQFSILLLLQVSEPITSQVIAPFLPQLIKDIGVTGGNDSRIPYYVGLMHSLFFLTEACTIFHWSSISDQIGRRPVLLTGLFGLSASMWCFGLSKTFWALILSRCLNGALNGNIGVMKSMTIEITDSTNIAQAYGILPITWSLGTTVGPLIGGSLANPVDRFPDTFGNSSFFKEYPYFLPCSVAASVTALSWLIAFLFMKETAKPLMTPWQYIFGGTTKDETRPDPLTHVALHDGAAPDATDKPLPFHALLTRPVIIAAGCYATFSQFDIAFRAIIPVFYALPIEMGGLHLGPPVIGNILAVLGVSGGIIQYLLFAPMNDWLGAKTLFLVSVSLCFPMIALFPVINAAARIYGLTYHVWLLVGLQLFLSIFTGFSYAVTFMFISAAAPNKASIGATNGLAQVLVSIMRAIAPVLVNSAYSFSIEKHIMGGCFAYWVIAAMALLSMWVGSMLPRNLWRE